MDLFQALETFARVTEMGSFSAVAKAKNSSHSAVTRLIGQLETHFGVRLFHRTTRRLSLTEDGPDLLPFARNLLDVVEGMEGVLGSHRTAPTGLVRIGTNVSGALLLTPRLLGLLERHVGLEVELVVRDRLDDMINERLDVAMQLGQPTDSSVMARKAGAFGRMLVAGPVYLERRGAPKRPADLLGHTCILHESGPDGALWQFDGPQGVEEIRVNASFRANNAEAVHRAVLAGYGIAKVSEALVVDDVRGARLYRLLPNYSFGRQPAFVLYPSRQHLPPRTRVVIDFLVEQLSHTAARLEQDDVWGKSETVWLM